MKSIEDKERKKMKSYFFALAVKIFSEPSADKTHLRPRIEFLRADRRMSIVLVI